MAPFTYNRTRCDSAAGFSLIELMIGMAITLGIVAIAGALLAGSFNIRKRENRRMEAIAAAQHALNYMTRDIANAGFALRKNGIVNADSDAHAIRIRANLDAFSGANPTANGTTPDSPTAPNAASLGQQDEDLQYFVNYSDSDENSTKGAFMRYDDQRAGTLNVSTRWRFASSGRWTASGV